MSASDTDQEGDLPHPRERMSFFGHEEAERVLSEALAGSRLHHAWLLCGPKGSGKATLAYRFARRALGATAGGESPLAARADDPVVRRIAQNAHPDLLVLRRGLNDAGKPRSEITVDEARAIPAFFALKPSEGGRRIAIVDSVDELNRNAANALLKSLEEPPPDTVLLLLAHAPGATLATLRSRCRRLTLRPLPEDQMRAALAADGAADVDAGLIELAGGRLGRALALRGMGAAQLRTQVHQALGSVLREGGAAVLPVLLERAGRAGGRLELLLDLVQDWIRKGQLAAHGVCPDQAGDPALMAHMRDPDRAAAWAGAWFSLETLRAQAAALDMDPQHAAVRIARVLDLAAAGRS